MDIIVGNPPYVRIQNLTTKRPVYVNYLDNIGYVSATKNYDLAVIFIERSVNLLKTNGDFGFIVTSKFMQTNYGEGIRRYVSRNNIVSEIVNFGDQQVFDEPITYTMLLFIKKQIKPSQF